MVPISLMVTLEVVKFL